VVYVDVGEELLGGRVGTLLGEVVGIGGFLFGGVVDFFDFGFVENSLVEEVAFEDHDRVGLLLFLDFGFGPVGFGVGHGVSAVAVGFEFENGGERFLLSALDGFRGFFAHNVEIVAVGDNVIHVVAES